MALDRAVLTGRASGEVPPTLRLYRWEVPTVTLGRFQSPCDVDVDLCRRSGFDVVRRPTGGRGVLHEDELTYSFVCGVVDGVPRGVAASYRHMSAALADAYRILGVEAMLTARSRGDGASGACYLHATPADLSLGAAKLSGSAQIWKDSTVLQHGSFVRSRDVEMEAGIFRLDPAARERLDTTTATLEDALGRAPAFDVITAAVVTAVERTLGVTLEPGGFSEKESQDARAMLSEHEMLASGEALDL